MAYFLFIFLKKSLSRLKEIISVTINMRIGENFLREMLIINHLLGGGDLCLACGGKTPWYLGNLGMVVEHAFG